jgi:hypothetical protein
MGNRARTFGERFGRTVVVIVGVLGALAAFDAVLLFVVLLLAGPVTPYIGLLMFVAVPSAVALGGTLAWAAFVLVESGTPGAHHDTRQKV